MGNYKRTQHGIFDPDGAFITEGGSGWDRYQQYISGGGKVDELVSLDELKSRLSGELKTEYGRRGNSKVQVIQALHRKMKGSTTQEDDDKLNKLDTIETAYKNHLAWVNDPSRTREDLEQFDPQQANWGV